MKQRSHIWTVALLLLAACDLEGELDGAAIPDDQLAAGDLVELDGVALEVPEIGHAAGVTVDGDDGWFTLLIDNTGDGVTVERFGTDIVDPEAEHQDLDPSNALSACSDSAFRRTGHRWRVGMGWRLGPTPSSYDRARIGTLLRRAATNIVSGRNDCGRPDHIGATHGFDGSASEEPGVSIANDQIVCSSDGRTVVGFKSLGSGFKAATCWWAYDGYLTESDIAFSRLTSWVFSDTIPSSCTSSYHFESVATHEFGHSFGLNHPGSSHSTLTMQPGAACDASKVTLGLGDLVGFEAIY
jgi:hypothetical protein